MQRTDRLSARGWSLASEAVLVLLADDSTGLDPHVCRPVVIAAANAEVHASDAPWACIAVVPLKLAGAVPDDPCGQVRGVEVRPHKWPAIGLFRSAVVRNGRLHCPSHKQASFRRVHAAPPPSSHLHAIHDADGQWVREETAVKASVQQLTNTSWSRVDAASAQH